MQSTLAQKANLSGYREASPKLVARAFKVFRGLFAPVLGRCVRVEDDIVTHYAGCAWTDVVERHVINGIRSHSARHL